MLMISSLTFTILWANSADNKYCWYFFLFYPEFRIWHFMQIDSSVKSLDHLTDNRNWPFKIANKVIVNDFSWTNKSTHAFYR